MAIPQNEQLFQRALRCIPGGVNSPVRAFKAVGGTPAFITRAEGAYMWDARGRRLIDYIGSWGPMILGHGHPEVLEAVIAAAREGLSFGAPTEREIELAEHILRLMPSMQMVRLVNSGTEAGMSAIRLARGFTGRSKIVKFEGCYHGHADALLVKAGSGLATFGQATSAGVPPEVVQDTLVLEYNNIAQLEEAFDRFGNEIACVIMEPIAGNMNFVRASTAFMAAARRLTLHSGALLIIDEVMTGFRVALGGAQSLYAQQIEDFAPDLTVMGKVIGGGMPLAAFGGPRSIMEQLAPVGGVYQAGTLSGNPVATACGLATLKLIEQSGFYERLAQRTQELVQGLKAEADAAGVPFSVDCEGGMFGFFFLPELPQNYAQVMQSESARFNQFFHGMLSRGVYFAPALYEAGFVSAAHSAQDVQESLAAAREVFAEMVGVKARKRGADEPALPGVETPAVVPDVIHFYRVADEWGEFSNFAPWPVRIDGKTWPTTEHYFQAQKFADQAQQEEIRRANTPMEAARMGRDRTRKLRRDWESAKDDVMRVALRAKFTQHEALRALLLATGDARIVEHTVNDSYWGDGRSGRGRNMLGLLLMELREALRSQ